MTPEEFNKIPAEEWVLPNGNRLRHAHMCETTAVVGENALGGAVRAQTYTEFRGAYTRREPWRAKFDDLKAECDGWQLHEEGAECPCVGLGAELLYGNGNVDDREQCTGIGWTDETSNRIVAYRIIKPALEPYSQDDFPHGRLFRQAAVVHLRQLAVWNNRFEAGFMSPGIGMRTLSYKQIAEQLHELREDGKWYQAARNGKVVE